ncbi:MAG: PAS domain S-box protein [Hydrogenophaga sp.]|uniref:sensor histidine kinase n=1 Tax=Hydrogenophaga sp. TaxID=1904254 RepID=UPI001DE97868|nr:ATP-binding protein [Hydrogenophaga sp.]MBX3608807.1 PAS domain S-box protein [Hydrogenophaga sp.]
MHTSRQEEAGASPRTRLLAVLVFCLTALAAGLLWWQAQRTQALLREQVITDAERRSVHLADAMAGQMDGLLALADLELHHLRDAWLQDPAHFDDTVNHVLDVLPDSLASHVSVSDAQGVLVFNSLSQEGTTRIDDREHFRALREGPDRLFVGSPVQSRLSGAWVVLVARPIERNGRFAGTLQMALSTDFLARRLATLSLSGHDIVALVGRDGRFLARSQNNVAAMGQRLPPDRPFLADQQLEQGAFHVVGQLDGLARTYGWRRTGTGGLVVAVGLADDDVMAPLQPALTRARNLAAGLTFLVVAGGALLIALLLRLARDQAQADTARALRYRLFDSSPVSLVVLDPQTMTLVDCNDAAARLYGFASRQDVLGRKGLEVSAPVQYDGMPSEEAARQWVERALATGSVVFEWLHQRPDGVQWDAEVQLSRFELRGRAMLQFALINTTARRQAESALRASEARLKEAQRIAGVGSWEFDLRTQHVSWSDELFRIFELDPSVATASYATFIACVHPDDRAAVNRAYRTSVEQRKPHDVVHRLLMPDGRVKFVRETGFTEFVGGEARRSVGTVQDITLVRDAEDRLRRLNEELEDRVAERTRELSQLNRELEAFAYSASHDLRTPLRTINGYAALLADDLKDKLDDGTRALLDRIRQAANRMGQLIDAMLSLARVNRGELKPEQVDVSAMARALLAELKADEPARTVRCHVDDGLSAWADADLLHAVLQNLIGNAWKYTRRTSDPEIRIERVITDGDEDVFCVIDNGAGFDMQFAHQLFEPFKRLHAPNDFEGTGVGLATVKRVVERHDGWLRGEGSVGRGARFCVGLPRRVDPM